MIKLVLVDLNFEVVEALRNEFHDLPEVNVLHGDILEIAECAVVSPANSMGFMDGGVDLAYRHCFGPALEGVLRDRIANMPKGCLPVGSAMVLPTELPRIPFVVFAPTMEAPEPVPDLNVRRAMSAALRAASKVSGLGTLYCPGLGTGVGSVPPQLAAHQMRLSYESWREH
ncbi:MAG: macro domain-containing protein [Calditrichaeota bacterium]|nr:macro domain-containing protein [Calditrichota bacterium]